MEILKDKIKILKLFVIVILVIIVIVVFNSKINLFQSDDYIFLKIFQKTTNLTPLYSRQNKCYIHSLLL